MLLSAVGTSKALEVSFYSFQVGLKPGPRKEEETGLPRPIAVPSAGLGGASALQFPSALMAQPWMHRGPSTATQEHSSSLLNISHVPGAEQDALHTLYLTLP